ncbi:MAG TPA: endo-1,4-beta-xylanase, partial [Pararobbsia sp.]|nr:endo-1,4-beta-xylanase [Pararobbsia sp.]
MAPRLSWLGFACVLFTVVSGCANEAPVPVNDGPPVAMPARSEVPSLKTVMATHFKVGAAIEPDSTEAPADAALIASQFSSLTAENKMKPGTIGIGEGRYD